MRGKHLIFITLAVLTFILISSNNAFSAITIQGYSVDYDIEGQAIKAFIQFELVADGLKKNQYYKEYSFGLPDFFKIKSLKSQKPADYSVDYRNNSIKLKFKDKIFNGDKIKIEIHLLRKPKIDNVIYSFWATVPDYVDNTLGRIKVSYPKDYRIFKIPDFVKKTRTGYLWMGRLSNGKHGLFSYSPNKITWGVRYVRQLRLSGIKKVYLKFIDFSDAVLFQKIKLKSVISPKNYTDEGDFISAEIVNPPKSVRYNLYLQIEHNTAYKDGFDVNLSKARTNDRETERIISRFVKAQGFKYDYASRLEIAERLTLWVNKYITYMPSYVGKSLPLNDIIRGRKGVCEEYTKLLLALLRHYKIPSLYISGYAYTTYEKQYGWGPHAFVAAYINGAWRYYDATWGMNTGYIPASHIVFWAGYNKANEVETKYEYNQGAHPSVRYADPAVKIFRIK